MQWASPVDFLQFLFPDLQFFGKNRTRVEFFSWKLSPPMKYATGQSSSAQAVSSTDVEFLHTQRFAPEIMDGLSWCFNEINQYFELASGLQYEGSGAARLAH
jgi:hypothetical protein